MRILDESTDEERKRLDILVSNIAQDIADRAVGLLESRNWARKYKDRFERCCLRGVRMAIEIEDLKLRLSEYQQLADDRRLEIEDLITTNVNNEHRVREMREDLQWKY